MEAASAVSGRRARRFERECERLRPLGEAYVLRHFAGALCRADAEDAVAEVLIRLHRRAQEGRPPNNLRAMFFASVRNAAIDLLRVRSARPATVALEAAAEAADAGALPAEWAESREDAVRLQEALARMRGNYRETILLRFGLGLTVPEIAAHFEISVAAAKKRVLRAAAQVRKRMAAIDAEEFCPQMRELARSSAFEKEASGLASEADAEVLRAHFSHCGSCRSYLAKLRGELHELGSAALVALFSGRRLSGKVDVLHQLGHWAGGAAEAGQDAAERLRHLALRASGGLSPGDGAAGAMMGAGQKIAAVCGAGAAATCLLSGAIGPGIGAAMHPSHADHRPTPKVKRLSSQDAPLAPVPIEPAAGAETAPSPDAGAESASSPPRAASEASPPSSAQPQVSEAAHETSAPSPSPSEFGIEGGSTSGSVSSGTDSTAPASVTESPPSAAGPSGGSGAGGFAGGSSGSGSAATATGGSVGFQG